MYEVFEHTADLGLRIRAQDLEGLMAESGRALFSILVANLDDVGNQEERSYQIAGTDPDYLLFDWLTELLYTYEIEHLLLSQFDVKLDAFGLSAVCRGEPADPARHKLEHEVKAITYHELKVVREDHGWLAEVIVDI
jgi:SHS2 domain-containing protein